MEALTISAANLDAIEKNLGAVANELTGVISNVSTVNNQVNKVEAKVASLNDEVKNLMKEIRETTLITNARQSIMYNNEQIEKKYGYYDRVRRTTESLIDAIENSNINKTALKDLKTDLLLNNPNYWLSNALAALSSWLLNDKENTEKELANALKKDEKKTSIFFCLTNLKLGRISTSLNWLNKYLSMQNPLKLDKDFVTILDLVATGTFGNEAKKKVLEKINIWFYRLNSEQQIKEKQVNTWFQYITEKEEDNVTLPQLSKYAKDISVLTNNLRLTSSYIPMLDELKEIISSDFSNKKIEEILNNRIYDYEEKEQIYQKDNLRNQLLITCNGNREEAEHLFQKQESVYEKQDDLISLLTNIVINKELYHVAEETRKIALSLVKEYIIAAYERKQAMINKESINIIVEGFTTKTDGKNKEEINDELELYLNNQFNEEDKDLIILLLLINILGIIGIFVTLNNRILSTILIVILVLGNVILFYKLNNRSKLRSKAKKKLRTNLSNDLEKILAEIIDYNNILEEDAKDYQNLINYLNTLNATNYINSNNERNINIGD